MSSMRSEKKAGVDVMPRSARGVAVKDDASNCRSSLTARKAAHTPHISTGTARLGQAGTPLGHVWAGE